MQQAEQAFKSGKYQQAIELYNQYLSQQQQSQIPQQNLQKSLLNLASVYYSNGQYQQSIKTCIKSVQKSKHQNKQPAVQAYILYCKCLIKLKKLLSHEQHQFIAQAQTTFPYHKVLLQCLKTVKQLQISQNQQEYMDRIFEKLLEHPKIRNYMSDEGFLTKVEKIIRNPSLAGALSKIDKRLEEVGDVILMAEDEQQEQRNNKKPKSIENK